MLTINVTEAKARFSEIVKTAAAGEEIIITRHGEPMVKINAAEKPAKRTLVGAYNHQGWIADDFNEWPEDIARSLGIID
jgi:prevent-host-death family protein